MLTAHLPCQPPTDGPGGSWQSAPASKSAPSSPGLLEHSGTGTLTPRRVPIACIQPPVGARPRSRSGKFLGSLCSSLRQPQTADVRKNWELRKVFPNRRVQVDPSPPAIRSTCDATTPPCQLFSPASTAYLDRAHSVAHVHVVMRSVPVVGYPRLPAFDSTSARTVARLTRGSQCSSTSWRTTTACALHSPV